MLGIAYEDTKLDDQLLKGLEQIRQLDIISFSTLYYLPSNILAKKTSEYKRRKRSKIQPTQDKVLNTSHPAQTPTEKMDNISITDVTHKVESPIVHPVYPSSSCQVELLYIIYPVLTSEEEHRVEKLLEGPDELNETEREEESLTKLLVIDSKLQDYVPPNQWEEKLIVSYPATPASMSSTST